MSLPIQLLISFAGGIFGAGFGAMNAFMLCGFSAVVGSVITMISGDPGFAAVLPWGPFLGPQVAFTGGVAAAAWAARKGCLGSGRDVVTPLYGLGSPVLLLVGGFFGALGQAVKVGLDRLPGFHGLPWINPIAMSIVLTGLLVRLLFGRSGLLGAPLPGHGRWRRAADEPWQPWQARPQSFLLVAVSVSLLAGLIARSLPRSTGLAFGLAAMTLAFSYAGAKIPIVLHIAWAAEYAVLLTGSLAIGLFCGLLAALLAELTAGLFLLHGDTHIDPPASAVAVTFALGPLLVVLPRSPGIEYMAWAAALLLGATALVILTILLRPRSDIQ
jgi:hypothetical protein